MLIREGKNMAVNETKCRKCGKVISVTNKIDTGKEYKYEKVNNDSRFIDKFGFERNFCKNCMKQHA
jgi:hypothetical protein